MKKKRKEGNLTALLNSIRSKLPTRGEAFPVFSTVVFIVFTWSFYRMAWQLQSWLYTLSIKGVLIIAAYVLAFSLFESFVVFIFLVIFSLLFPRKLFKDKFIPQGMALMITISVGAIFLQRRIGILYKLELEQLIISALLVLVSIILILLVFSFAFSKFPKLAKLVRDIADRMMIFSFIYIPLGLVCLIVVLARNIF